MQQIIGRFVPPPGPGRVLAFAQLASSIGFGGFLVCSALFFIRVVGVSTSQVGLGLTLAWAAGAFAGVPLGALADRRGPKGTTVLLAVATAAAVAMFLVVRSFVPFVLVAAVWASCHSGLSAAQQALLAGLVDPDRRTEIRAFVQSMTNAGLAIGAALGGLALQYDTEGAYLTVFALDAVGFLITALVLLRLPSVPPAPEGTAGEPKLAVLRDRPYALVSLVNAVMMLYMPMLSLIMPLWIVQRTDAPRWIVSALMVINMLTVVIFQVRVAGRVNGLRAASRFVRLSGAVMLASCAVFAVSAHGRSAWGAALVLIGAAILQVVGEMLLASGAWEISFGLAPSHRQGQYQGFFGMGAPVARTLGPLLLTTLILGWGTPGWLILGATFLIAGCAMAPAVRWAEGQRRAAEVPPSADPASGPTADPTTGPAPVPTA